MAWRCRWCILLPALASPVSSELDQFGAHPILYLLGPDGKVDKFSEVHPGAPVALPVTEDARPPWWAWPFSQVRMRLRSRADGAEEAAQPADGQWKDPLIARFHAHSFGSRVRARFAAEPRAYCSWVREAPWSPCQDCRKFRPCEVKSWDVLGTRDVGIYVPPWAESVHFVKLPNSVDAFWESYFDLTVFAQLAVGLVLVWSWQPLSESAMVHAAMGSIGSLLFLLALVLYWVIRESRQAVTGGFSGRSISGLLMMASMVSSTVRHKLVAWLVPSSAFDVQAWLNLRDPFYNLPVGWIVVICSCLAVLFTVVLGANMGIKFFASAPEPEGDVAFEIGPDGRRIDLLPPVPLPQRLLGWSFWGCGVVLLLTSTHVDTVSLAITLLVLFSDSIGHWLWLLHLRFAGSPGTYLELQSPSTFAEEGKRHTERALEGLRRALQTNPVIMCNVREECELRLRRFSVGGPHVHPPPDLIVGSKGWRCSIL